MSGPDDGDHDGSISLSGDEIGEEPAEAVVIAVAEVTGQSPLEMEPLPEVIDPDALNSLFDGERDQLSSVSVTFDYCGQRVTVTSG
ncbi:HalOD1 output domain-containing protein [Halosimplex amylolyticum]|uniref:HalOD1 output domain-containing protein n=1 Tax=Halosimplex amylolyticum TaxID=3396616 RepID=UPI003F57100A